MKVIQQLYINNRRLKLHVGRNGEIYAYIATNVQKNKTEQNKCTLVQCINTLSFTHSLIHSLTHSLSLSLSLSFSLSLLTHMHTFISNRDHKVEPGPSLPL